VRIPRRAAVAAAAAAAAARCAAPLALGAPSGAAFTTDPTGTAVNQNHFAHQDDVHLNGGPPCGAPAHAAALPDGDYAFRVTTPNGKTTLSSAPLAQRGFTVLGGVVVASTAAAHASACPGGGLVVRVGPFAASPNGVYKLWIVPASARGYESFPAKASKTDNFKVDRSGGDSGGEDPPPGGGGEF
jgi:hypothetical protein